MILALVLLCILLLLLLFLQLLYVVNKPLQASHPSGELNRHLYQQKVEQLEQEHQLGLVEDKESLLHELQHSLLADSANKFLIPEQKNSPYLLCWLAILLLITVSCFSYYQVGGWRQYLYQQTVIKRLPQLREMAHRPDGPLLSQLQMQELALAIRSQLQQQPNNVDDWMLLGDINLALRDLNSTLIAFSRAYQLTPEDEYIQLLYGQMLLRSQEQTHQQQGEYLLSRVLTLDANNLSALSALAFYRFSLADYPKAIELWQQMLTLLDDPERRFVIENSIKEAKRLQQ